MKVEPQDLVDVVVGLEEGLGGCCCDDDGVVGVGFGFGFGFGECWRK